jgi:hypothetical protein
MALSDYANTMVDDQGNSVTSYTFPCGTTIYPYKSYLCVKLDGDGDGSADIHIGTETQYITVRAVTICVAPAHHQPGIIFAASSYDNSYGGDFDSNYRGVTGVAVSGYMSGWRSWLSDRIRDVFHVYDSAFHERLEMSWVGIHRKTARRANRLLNPRLRRKVLWCWVGLSRVRGFGWLRLPKFIKRDAAYFKDISGNIRKVDFEKLNYRNPGDDYIVGHFGETVGGVPVGEKRKPLMHQLLS